MDQESQVVATAAAAVEPSFSVAHQKVELDIDFSQEVTGKTEITVYPDSTELKCIKLHARQCRITKVLVNGLTPPSVEHEDPCHQLALHFDADVHHHHILAEKVSRFISADPEPDLIIGLPRRLRIVPVDLTEVHTQTWSTIKLSNLHAGNLHTTDTAPGLSDTSVAKFTPLTVSIEFHSLHLREAVQFVSGKRGSGRWPHAYTRGKLGGGGASALFPCVDSINSRCTWDITLKCPRTVGDAINQILPVDLEKLVIGDTSIGGMSGSTSRPKSRSTFDAKDMVVVCSGELTDEMADKADKTKKTVSFSCSQQLAPQQIGFAIGPFERVNLNELRDAQESEELGRSAVDISAYCLPGRAEEVKNTCLPTTKAMDFIVQKYISCPVSAYSMCFVDDIPADTSVFAGVTMCSTRLLYPEDVIDPAQDVTRTLVHAIASQWIGINIVAEEPRDNWVVIGAAWFLTDLFMKDLCGNNEYRYRMKQQSDRVYELDHDRPSIYEMGALMHVDPAEYEFLSIKAPVVLFILDRRIAKVAGISKMPGILGKILTRARTGDLPNNALSTDQFQKTCERFYHAKIDDFITQWVKGAGCPRFQAFQRFNKKKLVVEMLIKQLQGTVAVDRDLEVDSFMRDAREDFHSIYAAPAQTVFTGPMTIRIHEADGTPYEHIVEIKDANTTFDIPYNTKYKRLKRNKRQRARPTNKATTTDAGEEESDALVYCLGDVLQSEEEILHWRITEWSAEDEERMNAESYEWIRLDADFEWICRINLQMPGYMFTSQLQQDRDVVAQLEAVRHISNYPASPLISSIFIRTVMDRRYFHGVRTLAAQGLVKHAKDDGDTKNIGLFHLKKAFEELYCLSDQGRSTNRPNDFSDQLAYRLQCVIIEALSQVRDRRGHAPKDVKEFLLDKLKFNDNSANDYSDAFYVARLMKSLCSAVIARPRRPEGTDEMDLDDDDDDDHFVQNKIENECLDEIDRYRRMDEWTSSYQNLYSRTALECQSILSQAGIGTFSPLHYLQYTRPGNYDMLRLTAYDILMKPDIFDHPSILRYILHCMVADASAWIRENLQQAFGKVLAKRAVGDTTPVQHAPRDSLVIEDTAVADARQKELARRQTLEGAIAALKKELGENQALQASLWAAISYSDITLEDLCPLLDFCRLLYEPVNEMIVTLRLPHYWKVENLGKGKLKFSQTKNIRTKIVPKWQPPAPTVLARPEPVRLATAGLKLTFKMHQSQPSAPPIAIPRSAVQTHPAESGRPVLKLKLKPPPIS